MLRRDREERGALGVPGATPTSGAPAGRGNAVPAGDAPSKCGGGSEVPGAGCGEHLHVGQPRCAPPQRAGNTAPQPAGDAELRASPKTPAAAAHRTLGRLRGGAGRDGMGLPDFAASGGARRRLPPAGEGRAGPAAPHGSEQRGCPGGGGPRWALNTERDTLHKPRSRRGGTTAAAPGEGKVPAASHLVPASPHSPTGQSGASPASASPGKLRCLLRKGGDDAPLPFWHRRSQAGRGELRAGTGTGATPPPPSTARPHRAGAVPQPGLEDESAPRLGSPLYKNALLCFRTSSPSLGTIQLSLELRAPPGASPPAPRILVKGYRRTGLLLVCFVSHQVSSEAPFLLYTQHRALTYHFLSNHCIRRKTCCESPESLKDITLFLCSNQSYLLLLYTPLKMNHKMNQLC